MDDTEERIACGPGSDSSGTKRRRARRCCDHRERGEIHGWVPACVPAPPGVSRCAAERDYRMIMMLRRILLAEDSANDIELTLAALSEHRLANQVDVVHDGAEALDYLYRR